MRRLAYTLALCANFTPAFAQESPIYAPCLQQVPAPQEFGELGGYIAAMQDAGWTHRTGSMMINRATPPLAELAAAATLFPSRFRNQLETQAFVDQAQSIFVRDLEIGQIFTRDGVSAYISSYEFEPGRISVICIFAGMQIPGFDTAHGDDPTVREEFAFSMGGHQIGVPEDAIDLNMMTIRFTGPEIVLTPLSLREGIRISYRYEAPD